MHKSWEPLGYNKQLVFINYFQHNQGAQEAVEMISQLDFILKIKHQQICPKQQVIKSLVEATEACEFALTQIAQELQGESSL